MIIQDEDIDDKQNAAPRRMKTRRGGCEAEEEDLEGNATLKILPLLP